MTRRHGRARVGNGGLAYLAAKLLEIREDIGRRQRYERQIADQLREAMIAGKVRRVEAGTATARLVRQWRLTVDPARLAAALPLEAFVQCVRVSNEDARTHVAARDLALLGSRKRIIELRVERAAPARRKAD